METCAFSWLLRQPQTLIPTLHTPMFLRYNTRHCCLSRILISRHVSSRNLMKKICGVMMEVFAKLVADQLYDFLEVLDLAWVGQLLNENSIKEDFNIQAFFWILWGRIGHSCILGLRITTISSCYTYHAILHELRFLLCIIIFETRILTILHIPSRLTSLSLLWSWCISLHRWFVSFFATDARNSFFMVYGG